VIGVVAAIALSTAAGVWAEHRWRDGARVLSVRLLDLLLYAGLPFITFFVIARLKLDAGVGVGLLLAYTELAVVGAVAYLLATRVLRAPRPVVGAVVVGAVLGNTGYFGIPLNAALLGHDAIAPAIAWDTIVSGPMFYAVAFAIGAAFGTRAGGSGRQRVKAFATRNPPLLALVAGLLAPDVLAPHALVVAAQDGAFALLPIAFFVLGVTLGSEAEEGKLAVPPPVTRPLVTIVGLRLLLAPALFAALGLAAGAAGARPPTAYFVQAAAPCGVNAIVVAHVYGLDLRLNAAAILWSTAIVSLAGLAYVALRGLL
jgi:predicted permease